MDYKADASYEERVEPKSLAAFFARIIDQRNGVKIDQVKIEDVRPIDGKTLRGTISIEQAQGAHLLSIYQGNHCATLARRGARWSGSANRRNGAL